MCQLLVQANANEPRAHAVYGDFLDERSKSGKKLKLSIQKQKNLGAKDFLVYNQLMFIYTFNLPTGNRFYLKARRP
jgi:hypothetical protein